MEPLNEEPWRVRLRAFLSGDYPGPPIDYLMAIAIVVAMILVVTAGLMAEVNQAALVQILLRPLALLAGLLPIP